MNISQVDQETRAMGESWWLFVVLGAIMIALGIFAIASPFITGVALSVVLGILLIIGAFVHAASLFRARSASRVVPNLLLALVYLLAGIALVSYPIGGLVALTLFLAAFFLVEGVVKIVGAFEMRPGAHWGWYLFSGIISVILALLIWSGWPAAALWVVGVLVGVDLISSGMAMLALGFTVHGAYREIGRPVTGSH